MTKLFNKAMESVENFLKKQDIPEHLINLLELVGIQNIRDLLELDESSIAQISQQISRICGSKFAREYL